jgi:glucose-1-phosphate cytidylyltransferase
MIAIGGTPILWHNMNTYSAHGFNDFLVACGYKGEVIKEYFHNLHLHTSDWRIELRQGKVSALNSQTPDWHVTLVDTGLKTQTGGRIRRLRDWVAGQTFMATYGDGVADVNLSEVLAFHKRHGKLATVTAVRPPARFGCIAIDNDQVTEFQEKPQAEEGWINGGFFVFEPEVIDYIADDSVPLELSPLRNLAADGELMAYRHFGFWQPMDTLREKQLLESMWTSGTAPWAVPAEAGQPIRRAA